MIRYLKKISYILLVLVIIVMFFNTNIVTADTEDTDFMDQASDFLETGGSGQSSVSFNTPLSTINNLLLGIGIGISVLVATVMAIKFILGAADEKAEIKEMVIPFVVGCVILFGAIGIFRLVINAFNTAM